MKKLFLSIALLGSFSLSAADMQKLANAILDNDVRKVKSGLHRDIAMPELQSLYQIAMQKNEFYKKMLRRWENAVALALAGAGLAMVLGAVVGTGVTAWVGDRRCGGYEYLCILIGTVTGGAIGAPLIVWAGSKIEVWQDRVQKSKQIIDLIEFLMEK